MRSPAGKPRGFIFCRVAAVLALGVATIMPGLAASSANAATLSPKAATQPSVTAVSSPSVDASASARGPAAVADAYGNEFVFWKGANGGLWEAVHYAHSNRWGKAHDLNMGKLGSEPTVAITNQTFDSGGAPLNAQYVYWRGANDKLMMAYWAGKWHGPVYLATGVICSQPAATFVGGSDGPEMIIIWKGLADPKCGNDSFGNHLWYIFSARNAFPPTTAHDYSGPTEDPYAHFIGSSPSITTVRSHGCAPSPLCARYVVVAWGGTAGDLWQEIWDENPGGRVQGPYKDARAGKLGSAPTVGTVQLPLSSAANTDTWEVVWRGRNGRLFFAHPSIGNPNVGAIEFPQSGLLDSAPTIAETHPGLPIVDSNNMYIFWEGGAPKHDLWEGFYNGTKKAWHLYNVGMGPL